jgi:hypothetical protein
MQRPQPEREAPSEPDDAVPGVEVVHVHARRPDTTLATALGVVAVLVALAILKPWGAGSPAATLPLLAVAPTAAAIMPAPTEDRTADGLAAPICLGSEGWRIASLERWRAEDVRVWRAIEPIADASGPLDPAIPAVPIVAVELTSLGWCAPTSGLGRPTGPAQVTAWSVRDGSAAELRIRQVLPIEGVTPIAALYVALTVCTEVADCVPLLPAPAPRRWDNERVVFRYTDLGAKRTSWLAADVTILPPTVP